MTDWDRLAPMLADYVETLVATAEETTQASDRPKYTSHLAAAARMFLAVERQSLRDLRQTIADERRSFGWDFLTQDCGARAESAFDQVARFVESLDDAG